MKTFSGFVAGVDQMVAVSEQFFTELLPLIDDVLELKVTLACLRLFDQKAGLARWTTAAELAQDAALKDCAAHVADGLERALQRGSLVGAVDRSGEQWVFLNDDYGRAAAQALTRGEAIEHISIVRPRPNIFVLYEQNIGTLTPLIADQLRAAEQEFPARLIEEAFAEAAKQNVRSWAYVKKILDKRTRKGKEHETRGRSVAADWQRAIQKDRPKK